MLAQIVYPLLTVAAILSGLVIFRAFVNDAYAPAWGAALALLCLFAVIVSALGLVVRCFVWSPFKSKLCDPSKNKGSAWECFPTLFLVGSIMFYVFYVMTSSCVTPREAATVCICRLNMKNIGYALKNYHQQYGSFPPAYVADENGRPMHSWRMLIAPYLEGYTCAKEYDLNEPWDGPNNRKLIEKIPGGYVCPEDSRRSEEEGKTSYVAVLGENAAWRGAKPTKFADFSGGTSNTVMIVEVADSDIAWTEPRDISIEELPELLSSQSGTRIAEKHRIPQPFFFEDFSGGMNVLRADGSAKRLPAEALTAERLPRILSVSGCPDEVCRGGYGGGVDWLNFGAVLVFVCAGFLLLRRWARDDVESKRE